MNHLRWHLLIAVIWTVFAIGGASASDSDRDVSASWHCYTGGGGPENWWVEATAISDIPPANLKFSMPNGQAFDRRFHWTASPSAIMAEIGKIGSADGREIYCITYNDKTQPGPCPYAIVCAIETGNKSGMVRPFFAYFFDPSSERGGGAEMSKKKGVMTLSVGIYAQGNGQLFSEYLFYFPKGRPEFVGRLDGGRKVKETLTK